MVYSVGAKCNCRPLLFQKIKLTCSHMYQKTRESMLNIMSDVLATMYDLKLFTLKISTLDSPSTGSSYWDFMKIMERSFFGGKLRRHVFFQSPDGL